MANETTFTLPNRDGIAKASGGIFKLALIGIVGFAVYVFLLPFLLAVAIGSVEFFVTAGVALLLFYFLTKKSLWRAVNYYCQSIAEKLLGMAIEMNPFMILSNQVDQAEKDRQELQKQGNLLKGQQSKLTQDIQDNDKLMKQSAGEIQKIKQMMADPRCTSDQQDNLNDELTTSTNNYNNAKDYIDSVKPILDSINKLVDFADRAYRKSGNALQNARMTIRIQKSKYDAVTTGSRAMNKAQAAFTGRADLNADSEKALEFLRKDVANKIGSIRGAIQITSQIMDHQDIADAAKAQGAVENAQQFNLDSKFAYSDTVTMQAVPGISSGNKFQDLLNSPGK